MTSRPPAEPPEENADNETDDPRLVAAWQALEEGDVAGARRQASSLDPAAPETLLLLAACAREDGDAKQALALAERAETAAPDWATPPLWQAELLAGDPDRLEEALGAAERALDRADDEGEYLSAIALKAGLEIELGDADAARETMQDLPPAEVRLGDLDTSLEIADLHIAVGDVETARERLRVVCEEHPESADAWYMLGAAAAELDDEEAMRAAWKRTWTLDTAPGRDGGEPPALSEEELAAVAESALRELPERARELLRGIPILVTDHPAEADVDAGLDPRAFGLFSGTPHPEAGMGLGGQPGLTQIVLFRRNLERAVSDPDELREEVRLTLLHETGHFFGLSDAELEEMGLG
ncbi:MAG TPA: metallopeptidase family protein [Polyangia bacterium]|nr:metallopeptidase family protein [Polyangia bacterium]